MEESGEKWMKLNQSQTRGWEEAKVEKKEKWRWITPDTNAFII